MRCVEMSEKNEMFELIFCAANFFIEAEFMSRLSDRFHTVFPKSGLPITLKSTYFPIAFHIDRVFEADCTQDEKKDIIECWKEGIFCTSQFFSIAQTLRNMKNIDANSTFVAVFISPRANMKDSHGDCDFEEETGNWIITVGFQRLDAIISTIFHELYEIFFYNDEEDVHCNNTNCYMNTESASLTLCDSCRTKVKKKVGVIV
jgi:hypothetical protein